MTTEEREGLAKLGKFVHCPLCTSTREEPHSLCFHCRDCGYLQCCDNKGFYDNYQPV